VGTVTRDALCGRWTHSHEEDTSDRRVYRPPSHPFPPSRGRASFELKADGTMIEHAIGPTDRSARRDGTWELRPDGRLVLRPDGSAPEQVLDVVSVTPDRLVVRR
jgi:hypothetical protein